MKITLAAALLVAINAVGLTTNIDIDMGADSEAIPCRETYDYTGSTDNWGRHCDYYHIRWENCRYTDRDTDDFKVADCCTCQESMAY